MQMEKGKKDCLKMGFSRFKEMKSKLKIKNT
jgi:hypothetical protein